MRDDLDSGEDGFVYVRETENEAFTDDAGVHEVVVDHHGDAVGIVALRVASVDRVVVLNGVIGQLLGLVLVLAQQLVSLERMLAGDFDVLVSFGRHILEEKDVGEHFAEHDVLEHRQPFLLVPLRAQQALDADADFEALGELRVFGELAPLVGRHLALAGVQRVHRQPVIDVVDHDVFFGREVDLVDLFVQNALEWLFELLHLDR